MAHGLFLQVFWICALLFSGCAGALISKDYRLRSQNRNIGDDADDERLISSGSEAEDTDSKPASFNAPIWGSSQQNMQSRPSGRDVGQLNRVAQAPMENPNPNKPLAFPLSVSANQLGAVNQQLTATGFKNGMPSSSSGFSVHAAQGEGPVPQFVLDSRTPERQGLLYEDIFKFRSQESGPSQHYSTGRGYSDGRHATHLGSRGSTFNAGMPFYQRYPVHVAGPSGVAYRGSAPTRYDEGLNSNLHETVPQGTDSQVMPPPPPFNPVYLTQSRYGYSNARYTHSHTKYSPDPDGPMPVMTVDSLPSQDVPGIREETRRTKW